MITKDLSWYCHRKEKLQMQNNLGVSDASTRLSRAVSPNNFG